jgi:hypothetical protein
MWGLAVGTVTSPLKYQPNSCSIPSLGSAMKPSNDIDMWALTFAMVTPFSSSFWVFADWEARGYVPAAVGTSPGSGWLVRQHVRAAGGGGHHPKVDLGVESSGRHLVVPEPE